MEQPDKLEVRLSYDMEGSDSLRDYQREHIERVMAIPPRLLYNPTTPSTVELKFKEDTYAGSISEALALWFANIKYAQGQAVRETQWTYVRYTKWLNADWRRVKRERRKFFKAGAANLKMVLTYDSYPRN